MKVLGVLWACVFVVSSFFARQSQAGDVPSVKEVCVQVKVHARSSVAGVEISKTGSGMIFFFQEKPFILTPFHVVAGAPEGGVELSCRGQRISTRWVGGSATLDLAVLRPAEPTPILRPVFIYDQRPVISSHRPIPIHTAEGGVFPPMFHLSPGPVKQQGVGAIFSMRPKSASRFQNVLFPLSSVYRGPVFYTENHKILPGYQTVLTVGQAATRAGMSGDLVLTNVYSRYVSNITTSAEFPRYLRAGWRRFAQRKPKGFNFAMIVKSERNGYRSLALPGEEIWPHLKNLLAGKDSWRETFPKSPFLTLEERGSEKDQVDVVKVMNFPDGSRWVESCAPWSDSGGWADDREVIQVSSLQTEAIPFPVYDVDTRVKKSLQSCGVGRVTTPDGRHLIGLFNQRGRVLRKVDALAKIFDLAVQKGDDFQNYVSEFGVFEKTSKGDLTEVQLGSKMAEKTPHPICNAWWMRGARTLRPRLDPISSAVLRVDRRILAQGVSDHYIMNTGVQRFYENGELNNPLGPGMDLSQPKGTIFELPEVFRCDDENRMHITPFLRWDNPSGPYNADMGTLVGELGRGFSGTLKLGRCHIDLGGERVGLEVENRYWSSRLRDRQTQADILIELSPDPYQLFQISIFSLSKECGFIKEGQPTWFFSYRIQGPE